MKNMQWIVVGIVALVVIAAGGYLLVGKKTSPTPDQQMMETSGSNGAMMQDVSPTEAMMEGSSGAMMEGSSGASSGAAMEATNVKTFDVTGENFSFDPKEITVNKGDTVKINFKSVGGMHDWMLDEFNAKTKRVTSGESDFISFVADKAGTFEYYCSVGNHRAMGMVGKLIVK